MATNVHLTADLERFARSCVESGRYNNLSEVVRQALRLLQNSEERRTAFTAMIHNVQAETEQGGNFHMDEVAAEMDAIIQSSKP